MNEKLKEIKNISLKKNDEPVDFSKYLATAFIENFKNFLSESEIKEVSTILYDLEALDLNQIEEKMNNGNFLAENKFGYNLLKTFIYSFKEESLKTGSKLNTYITQLENSLESNKQNEAEELIAIIYLSLQNNLIQALYALAYFIVENENLVVYENQNLTQLAQNKQNKAVAAQIAGGATMLFSDSEKLKAAGGAGLAYGLYKEFSADHEVNSQASLVRSLKKNLDKSYLQELSYLVSGSQLATKLNNFDKSNELVKLLTSKILEKWSIACKFVFSTNEFKSFLLVNFLLSENRSKISNGVISKSKYIFESTDLIKSDFTDLNDSFKKIKEKKSDNAFKYYGTMVLAFASIFLPIIFPEPIINFVAPIGIFLFFFLLYKSVDMIKPESASIWEFKDGKPHEYIFWNYDLKSIINDYESLLDSKKFYL